MASNNYKIFQAQILNKDPITPRQYTVVQIPDGYKMSGVQLPNALKDQSAPLLNSIVLVLQLDAYRSYIISVLREPFDFLSANQQYRGFIPDINDPLGNPIQDGEIFMEAAGTSSPSGVPGTGAHLYLGNNGSAQIESGSMGEKLVIGGTGSDDDHEVVLSADNGFIESNPNQVTLVQSTFNWDSLNNLQLGNVLANTTTDITTPISELTMDTLGNVTLRNTTLGVDKSSLKLDTVGNISITGTTVDLNKGTLGVARLTDSVFSSLIQDPAFWNFIQTLFITFNTHTHVSAAPGDQTSPPVPLLISFPTQLKSVINSASTTVVAGD